MNQIPFLSRSGSLTSGAIMNMDVSCAIPNGVSHVDVTFKFLVQIPCLSYVDRNPTPVFGLFGINVNARQRAERSVKGMNLVLILFPGLAGPIERRRRDLQLLATTQ